VQNCQSIIAGKRQGDVKQSFPAAASGTGVGVACDDRDVLDVVPRGPGFLFENASAGGGQDALLLAKVSDPGALGVHGLEGRVMTTSSTSGFAGTGGVPRNRDDLKPLAWHRPSPPVLVHEPTSW